MIVLYILPVYMAVNEEQQRFLEQLAQRIPRLFDAIRAGNIKSEYILGVRLIGQRQVRLKLVAEIVDPGVNPLRTHGTLTPIKASVQAEAVPGAVVDPTRGTTVVVTAPDDESSG
ncbi:MAG: hypothetical protein AB8B87_08795 [Granulosicoccus sp.]